MSKFNEPLTIKNGQLCDNTGRAILWVGNSDGAFRIKDCLNEFEGIEDPQAFMDAVREFAYEGNQSSTHNIALQNKIREMMEAKR